MPGFQKKEETCKATQGPGLELDQDHSPDILLAKANMNAIPNADIFFLLRETVKSHCKVYGYRKD